MVSDVPILTTMTAAAVLAAAQARAEALAAGDAGALIRLLHPDFRWTTHVGQVFDRDQYVGRNTDPSTIVWSRQDLGEATVTVVADTAVLHTWVVDTIDTAGGSETFRMPMTQTWVRASDGWRCLAGHAGPRITDLPPV